MKRETTIGFDRRVRIEWLDAIAGKQAAGVATPELRKYGHDLLRSEYRADEARGKTLTVIFHIWVQVPPEALELRNDAARMLAELEPEHRIALHWGMALATYPFFRDVADATGRLLALQDSVSLGQIQRRVAERWGQRSTAERAVRRIVRSWIDWGMLTEKKQRGVYFPGKRVEIVGRLACWLVEALLVGSDTESVPVLQVRNAPGLFPFGLSVSAEDLRRAPRLSIHRQGVDEDVVTVRKAALVAFAGGGHQLPLL